MTEFDTTVVDDSGDVHGQVTLVTGNAGLPVIAYTTQSGEVRLVEQNSLLQTGTAGEVTERTVDTDIVQLPLL